ncbi:DUF29 family protein [Methylocystis sp. JR02]|nr:DUF29 family protein [Methylocystis sp. JR02]MDJ0447924.1 DUF29 family protein [Methylocystis sp. JR02]
MDLSDHLRDNPSLKPLVPDVLQRTFRGAVIEAVAETGLPHAMFPHECPWTFDEIMAEEFWPE